MPSKMNGKNRMYDFEKVALLIALVITVAIVLLVVFATRGSDEKPPSGESEAVYSPPESAGDSAEQSTVLPLRPPEEKTEFVPLKVSNACLSDGALVLVNQQHKFTANIESKLLQLNSYNSEHVPESAEGWYNYMVIDQRLREEVIVAFNAMYKDFHASMPDTKLTVMRTYVDAATQQKKYEEDLKSAEAGDRPYLQAGGCGECQTGLAIVFYPNLTEDELSWFGDNCGKYGFVARYPEGKESITYVKGEKTHFRYVGAPHALYIKRNRITLEEYLAGLYTKTYNTADTRLKLDDGTSVKYEAYACKAQSGAETELMVPAESSGWKYEISGTNAGYFIVTMSKAG